MCGERVDYTKGERVCHNIIPQTLGISAKIAFYTFWWKLNCHGVWS